MHCIAYSRSARPGGIETFGRTSYLFLGTSRERLGRGVDNCGADTSFELSPPSTGVVALLESEDRTEDSSEGSDAADIDEVKEVPF